MKRLLVSALFLLITVFLILFNSRPRPEALRTYSIEPSEVLGPTGLTVQFLGNTNLVFSDGETTFMTDGFFTRPPFYKMLWGKVKPNKKTVQKCLDRAGISRLDAVIPVHSHYDHVLDAPLVADLTGATLIGSPSTLNVGRGYGLDEDRMTVVPLTHPVTLGRFEITFVHSRHWQYPDTRQRELLLDQGIPNPLTPPASIYDYKEGVSYTLLIRHDSTNIAIQGSAGFKEYSIIDFDADVLFLAIAGIEVMDEAYNAAYQEHVVEAVSPETLIPVHWDDFTLPLSRGLKTTNAIFNMKFGSNLGKAFEILETNNTSSRRRITILPLWETIQLKDLPP